MTTIQDTTGDVALVILPLHEIAIAAGTSNPNCVCQDGEHRAPGCPQHPTEGGGTR